MAAVNLQPAYGNFGAAAAMRVLTGLVLVLIALYFGMSKPAWL